MIRRRRRTTASVPRPIKKYSNETFCWETSAVHNIGTAGTRWVANATVIPAANNILGIRKCKNFTYRMYITNLNYHHGEDTISTATAVAFAVVYVPEGIQVANLNYAPQPESMFEPNQNVICSGICISNTPCTVSTRLARNLNSGDSIKVVFMCLTPVGTQGDTYDFYVVGSLNYAITF